MADIEVSRDGRVQIVRFNRVEKKNAITRAMYKTMADAIVGADSDPEIGATVLLGQPEVFTSGNDLKDFMAVAMGSEHGGEVGEYLAAIATGTKPLLAGVDGLAVGVGTTTLMHCDLVYASPRAWLKTPFVDLGLVPEAASSLIGPRIMGHQRAFELLIMGERFSAEQAREAGLINAVVDTEELEDKVMTAAKNLANKPPEALAISRRLVRGNRDEIVNRIKEEGEHFSARLKSDEARQAFVAFMQG